MAARGLRNNNPLNMRLDLQGNKFTGEILPSQDRQFRQFETIAYGYRGAFRQMELFIGRGINTIRKIITTWAPPTENDTGAYIYFVCRLSGIAPDQTLTLQSGEELIKIVAAMSEVENATPAVMSDVNAGFKLQDKITKII